MAEPWVGLVQSTIANYIKGREDNTKRTSAILSMLKGKARIKYNQSGLRVEKRIRYKNDLISGYVDGDEFSYARTNTTQTAQVTMERGFQQTKAVTQWERMLNRGAQAVFERFAVATTEMMDELEQQMAKFWFTDGYLAANAKYPMGIESFFGVSGTQAVIGSVAMAPSDTYADLSTTLGNYGGSWTGTWPKGNDDGSSSYDFWSPLILDYTSTLAAASGGWTSSTATWAARCPEVMRYAVTHGGRNQSELGKTDLILMERELFRQYKDSIYAKDNIYTLRDNSRGLPAMGYAGEVLSYEGVDLVPDFWVPSGVAYGINFKGIEGYFCTPSLFQPDPVVFDEKTRSHRFGCVVMGNWLYNPRSFWKLAAYGSSGA